MPRTGRLHIPGGCYHLIGRGLERRYIFEHAIDKRDFLTRFGKLLERTSCQCLAWTVMSNHYHFLVRVSSIPLSKLMAPLLGGFAGAYNRRYDRTGYVFQNRYASILCDEDNYLLKLITYIHLNPLRAGMLDSLDDLGHYPWSGHAGMLGRHIQDWHATSETLSHFGASKRKAINEYLRLAKVELEEYRGQNLSGGGLVRSSGGWEEVGRLRQEHKMRIGDERILGDPEFVMRALEEDQLDVESQSELHRRGWNLDRLINRACHVFKIKEPDLMIKSRSGKVSRAKAMICYFGTTKLGVTTREIAQRLNISQPAVSKWIAKGRTSPQDEELLGELNE